MKKIVTLMLATGVSLSLVGSVDAWPDIIQTTAEQSYSGTITAMAPDEVTITVRGGRDQIVKCEMIKSLYFDDEPIELKTVKRNIAAGQFDVLGQLNAINFGALTPSVKTEFSFYKVKAESMLALAGQQGITVTAAAKNAIKFADDPGLAKSWHYYETQELVGDLAMGIGNTSAAIKYYKRLASSESTLTRINGFNKVAEAQFSSGDYESAYNSYDDVIKIPAADIESRRKQTYARVGQAACDAEKGNHAKSIEFLQKLIKEEDSSDNELFGRIYNALGRCYRKAGNPKEAIHAYLFTDVVFNHDPNNHSEALYYLVDLWDGQNKAERGLTARNLLKTRYPNSPWSLKMIAEK